MSELRDEARAERRGKQKEKKNCRHDAEEQQQQEEQQQEEQSETVLLRGIFKVGKKSHDVLLTQTKLTWIPIIPETPTDDRQICYMAYTDIPLQQDNPLNKASTYLCEVSMLRAGVLLLQDVFAVKVKRRRGAGQQSGGAVLGLALFCCRRRERRLEEDTLHLHNASLEHTHTWYNKLKDLLTGFSSRPRYLKVFINPSSHKKEAIHIYREHVAPLFKKADIRTDITVTERKGHSLSVLKECKLDEYDGVVCVAGDGSVAELCHALVLRAQLDANSPEEPVKAMLPMGIIPAGSTDVVSCSVHGVRDPVTAAFHIILGHLQQVDMCSFSSYGELVRFGFSAMFGFGGRSLACAEKKRWMPSSQRREYALVKTLARLRDQDKCSESEGEENWTTNHGLYLNISVMCIPCLSPHAPRGLAPNTSLANGSALLVAVGNTSRSEFVKHLKRYSSSSGQFNFPFVETHSVSAVKVRPFSLVDCSEEEHEEKGDAKETPIIRSEGMTFPWNIDGELVEIASEVLIRVHSRLITLYGEEVDEAEMTPSCNCF